MVALALGCFCILRYGNGKEDRITFFHPLPQSPPLPIQHMTCHCKVKSINEAENLSEGKVGGFCIQNEMQLVTTTIDYTSLPHSQCTATVQMAVVQGLRWRDATSTKATNHKA